VVSADEVIADQDVILVEERADIAASDIPTIIISEEEDEVPSDPADQQEHQDAITDTPIPTIDISPTQDIPIPKGKRSTHTGFNLMNFLNDKDKPHDNIILHTSLAKALKDEHLAQAAEAAMEAELRSIITKDVLEPIMHYDMKGMKPPIPSHMFMKEKFAPDGRFDKLKGRLVGGGNFQDRSDYLTEDISSPTAALPFVYTVAGIAAQEGRYIVTADIPVAYLNADSSKHNITIRLDKTITAAVIKIKPEWNRYVRPEGTMICKLKKALYGCIESGKLWYDLIKRVFESDGYICNPIEPCVFNKLVDNIQCTCVIYVDDLMFTCKDITIINHTLDVIRKAFQSEPKTQYGLIHDYLGKRFDFSIPGEVKVSMTGYIDDMLKLANITGTSDTPAAAHLFTIRPDAKRLDPKQKEYFHSMVARALYLVKHSRGDGLLAVSFLTTRVSDPDEDDMKKLNRLLRYFNSTRDLALIIKHNPGSTIEAYIDASYGIHNDCRSHTGMIITLGHGAIDTRSTKQKLNTKSSTESELVALSDMCGKVIWCREFLIGQGMNPPPARVYQDNQSTLAMIKHGSSTSDRTKHVSIRYFWVKDRVDQGEIEVIYCPTEDMIADILTKPLQGETFKKLRALLLNWTF